MSIDLYYIDGSPPCRNVLLTIKAVGVDVNLKFVDLEAGEHLKPEYLKLNPQHTVPTLDDNGFVLTESRAIMSYLVNRYGKDDSLYPKDPKKRATVDQRLYFDMGTLYQLFSEYYYPVIMEGASYDPEKLKKIEDAFKCLEIFLSKSEYVAGSNLTIADLALLVTVTTYEVMKFDLSSYKNITKWLAKLKATAPGYEEGNAKPLQHFKQWVDQCMAKK